MPLDYSMYGNMQAPDIMGGIEKGMKLGEMIGQKREAGAIKDAFKRNVDAQGKQDRAGLLKDLAGINPEKAMAYQKEWSAMDQNDVQTKAMNFKQKAEEARTAANLFGSVKDNESLKSAVARAQSMGLDTSFVPGRYDGNQDWFLNQEGQALTAAERWEQKFKESEVGRDQANKDRGFGLDQQRMGIQRTELAQKRNSGDSMPLDAKKTIEGLASKNAGKISIKNQIDAVLGNWDSLSEDQQVTAGRQLLKTLNSTEGSDAVGAEESKRLGGKLEFALGNLSPWNSNPVQFGRDLKGFFEQASNVSQAIGTAVDSNKAVIDQTYGRAPRTQSAAVPPRAANKTVFKTADIEWAN